MRCRECKSENVQVNKHPLAWLGGMKFNNHPNVEIYCYDCTVSYCEKYNEELHGVLEKASLISAATSINKQ